MGYALKKYFVFMNTNDWNAPYVEYLGFSEEKIDEYLKSYPMPDNHLYVGNEGIKELKKDLCHSNGILLFEYKLNQKTIDWLEDLLNFLME